MEPIKVVKTKRHDITGVTLVGLLFLTLLALILSSCRHDLEVNESVDFEVSNMPYYKEVIVGQTVEVRMELATENRYEGTKYTVRYFPYSGAGRLRVGSVGQPLSPNDRYEVKSGAFRVYYTPGIAGNHSLELVFEDNHGNARTVILDFNASELGKSGQDAGKDVPTARAGLEFEPGKPYVGSNGNWFIDGMDSGIKSGVPKERLAPEVTVKDGHYYINGKDSGLEAPNDNPVTVSVDKDGYFTIDGKKTGLKAPDLPKRPQTGATETGDYYTLDRVSTPIPYPKKAPGTDYTNPDNLVDVSSTLALYSGKPQVLLVSKGGKTTAPGSKSEIEYAGVLPGDGSATYRVYDKDDKPAGFAIVRDLPHLKGQTFTADKDGFFSVKRELLPRNSDNLPAVCSVSIGGKSFGTEKTTVVPSQMLVSLNFSHQVGADYYFAFTQTDDTGRVALPITVANTGNWITPDNVILLTEKYKAGLFGIGLNTVIDGLDSTLASEDGGYLKVSLPEELIPRPLSPKNQAYFLTVALRKAPYGGTIAKSFMLGFTPGYFL